MLTTREPRADAIVRPAAALSPRVALTAVLVLCAGLRLALLATPLARLESDEAVTAIMAQRILQGDHRVYYAGQAYMGSLEQYLQAAVFAVLPDTPFTLRLPQVAIAVVSCWLVWRLALRCYRRRDRATLAALLFAVGPYANLLWNVKSRGGYAAAMVLGLAGLVLALETRTDDRWLPWRGAAFGLVSGLAAWVNPLAVYLLLPAGLWLLGTVRGRRWAVVAPAVGGFLLGAAPALAYLVAVDVPALGGNGPESTAAERAAGLLDPVLALFLGLRTAPRHVLAGTLPPALAVLALLVLLGAAVGVRRRGLGHLLALRRACREPVDALLLCCLVAPPIYVLSPSTWWHGDPRYLYPLYGVVPVLVAGLLPAGRVKRGAVAAALVLAVAFPAAVAAARSERAGGGGESIRGASTGTMRVRTERLAAVAHDLRALGIDAAYADYWLAYPLHFVGGGNPAVAPFYTDRFPHIRAAVEASAPAYLVPARDRDDVAAIAGALDGLGVGYRQAVVGGLMVFHALDAPVHPANLASDPDELELELERGRGRGPAERD